MKSYSHRIFAAFAVTSLGLFLTGCQQTPPTQTVAVPVETPAPAPAAAAAPAPSSTTESTVVTKSSEVKPADPYNPDSTAQKTTTTESTTVKKKQE